MKVINYGIICNSFYYSLHTQSLGRWKSVEICLMICNTLHFSQLTSRKKYGTGICLRHFLWSHSTVCSTFYCWWVMLVDINNLLASTLYKQRTGLYTILSNFKTWKALSQNWTGWLLWQFSSETVRASSTRFFKN